MTKNLRVTATLTLPGDLLEQGEKLTVLKPIVDAFKVSLLAVDPSATVELASYVERGPKKAAAPIVDLARVAQEGAELHQDPSPPEPEPTPDCPPEDPAPADTVTELSDRPVRHRHRAA